MTDHIERDIMFPYKAVDQIGAFAKDFKLSFEGLVVMWITEGLANLSLDQIKTNESTLTYDYVSVETLQIPKDFDLKIISWMGEISKTELIDYSDLVWRLIQDPYNRMEERITNARNNPLP